MPCRLPAPWLLGRADMAGGGWARRGSWHSPPGPGRCSHPGEAHPDPPVPLGQGLPRVERIFKQGTLVATMAAKPAVAAALSQLLGPRLHQLVGIFSVGCGCGSLHPSLVLWMLVHT